MLVSLLFIAFSAALARPIAGRFGLRVGAALLALPFAASALYYALQAPAIIEGAALSQSFSWVPSLGIDLALHVDGLGLLFSLLVGSIGALVIVHAAGYFDEAEDFGAFASLALLFGAAMQLLVIADDVFVLFLGWELTSVCSFLLIGLKHRSADARAGAMRALLVAGAGGIALLIGLLLLAQDAGSTSLQVILSRGSELREGSLYLPALLLVLFGALSKSAQFPFHYWLPGAMAAPSPVSAFLHSATLVKAGLYLLARLHPALGFREEWHLILGHIGAATMLIGALAAFVQQDLKRMLAFTTVAGLGTVVMLLGIGTTEACRAAIAFLGVHALYKAALFMLVGYLDRRFGSRDLRELRGLLRHAPFAFAVALLAGLSMAGLPPLVGAVAKELVYEAKLAAPEAPLLLMVVASLANALLVACAASIIVLPFLRPGAAPERREGLALLRLMAGPVLLAVLGLLFGLGSESLIGGLLGAAAFVVEGEAQLPEFQDAASPVLVQVVSKGGLVLGLLLFAARARLLPRLQSIGAGLVAYGPTRIHDALFRGLLALGAGISKLSARAPRRRGVLLALSLVLVACSVPLLRADSLSWPRPGLLPPHEFAFVILVLSGAVVAALARSRVASVAALGAVGLGVGGIFLMRGGPDLALTQIAVETLAVLLLLVLLGRVPRPEARAPRLLGLQIVFALAVGLCFTLLTWAALPNGELRPLARALSEASVPEGFGRNIVNVILVDFRSLDTLGEIVVLCVAALGAVALLRRRDLEEKTP